MLVAISGNIASGKTSLTKYLARALGFFPIIERAEENPYFHNNFTIKNDDTLMTQIYFLLQRAYFILKYIPQQKNLLLDRTIYEDANIFAKYFYLNKRMVRKDWITYQKIYKAVTMVIPKPNLLIYLKIDPSVLYKRLRDRNMPYDKIVKEEYLKKLDVLYNDWIRTYVFSPILKYSNDFRKKDIKKDIITLLH